MSKEQILIVEDEALVAEDIKIHLEENGWHVPAVVASGEDALDILTGTHIDLILMDIVLTGEKDGIDTAAIIKNKYHIPVIYLTAHTDQEKVNRARLTDPYGYLVKPFDERELKTTVSMTLSKSLNDRAIREGKRWSSAVLDSIEDGVITTDRSGRIRDINPSACKLLERFPADCVNMPLTEIIAFGDDATQQQLRTSAAHILQAGSAKQLKLRGQLASSKTGTVVDAKLSSISYTDERIDGLVITFHDVTLEEAARIKLQNYNAELEQRVKERTEEITRALEIVEAANRAKSHFLANMSHELRTPLNPITSYSQLLMLDTGLTQKQKEMSGKIFESSQSLLDKIDKLITLSQLATKKLISKNSSFDPAGLIKTTISEFQKTATEKNIQLVTTLPDRPSFNIHGDYDNVYNILKHLTDNALKFTEHGKIELGLKVITEDEKSIVLHFSVEDSGPGIRNKIMNAIFGHFTQADESTTRKHQGMGIGLTLSKQMVEHMGGRIGVDNRAESGARFWFEIPFKKAS